jgi:hypothetical protein
MMGLDPDLAEDGRAEWGREDINHKNIVEEEEKTERLYSEAQSQRGAHKKWYPENRASAWANGGMRRSPARFGKRTIPRALPKTSGYVMSRDLERDYEDMNTYGDDMQDPNFSSKGNKPRGVR